MHPIRALVFLFTLLCGISSAVMAAPPEPLRLAIQSNQSESDGPERWQGLADFLAGRIGRRVEVKRYPLGELETLLSHNQADVVLSNPAHYISLKHFYNLSAPVATLMTHAEGQDLEAYCGVIFARASDERIHDLADLRHARIAVTNTQSFGGFRAQQYELLSAGLPVLQPEQITVSDINREQVPDLVLAGKTDVGFLRSGVLESLTQSGRLDPTRIKILHRQTLPNFPLACSTRLFPEWPVLLLPQVDERTAKQIVVALLSLPADSPAAKAAEVAGFAIPANYDGVEQAMQSLHLPPFHTPPQVRLEDVWRQYRGWILTLAAAVLLLLGFGIALMLQIKRVHQARQRFATLFEFSPEPMWILENGRFTDCNGAALRMLGQSDKSKVIGLTQPELSPPMQADGLSSEAKAQMLLDIVKNGQPMRFEWVHLKADGREFIADVSLSPARLDGRDVILCAWYDISDLKRIEMELLDIQHQLQSTLSAIPDLLFEVDLNGRYFSYRTPNTDLLAAPPSALMGRTVSDVMPADAAQTCLAALRQANEQGHAFGHQILLPLPIGPKWFELSVAKKGGLASDQPRFVVLSRDITERKQAEQDLRHSQEILRRLASQIPGGLYQYQMFPDGRILFPYASDGFYELYELTPEELAADSGATRRRWHPDDAQGMIDSIRTSAQNLAPWKHEYRLTLPKKGIRWMLANARPERQGDGCILWHGAIIDITETKRIAEELEHHRHNLEAMLAERTADLVAARDAAESASRAKSTFLANMSHELRTPMNAIIGMTELALRRAQDPRQIDHLRKVRQASRHLLSVINDILDISKIEADRLVLESIDFQPAALLENLTTMMEDRAREKHLDFRVEIAPSLRDQSFSGDPLRLSQILLNLCGNAIKFTESGSVKVMAEPVSQDEHQAELKFSIADTGPGISKDDLQRLFNPFEQADSSTTRRFGGTGLGLAISQRLTQAMGGNIDVASTPGGGSTFCFTIRVSPPSQGYRSESASVPRTALDELRPLASSKRILLAEDEPINQEIAREILEEVGFTVDVANDGVAALDLAEQHRYDLILMDIQMPRMNGLDAAQAINRLPHNSACPVIAMTANAFAEDRAQCLAAGMVDHIAKPVVPEILFQTLLRWLRNPENG